MSSDWISKEAKNHKKKCCGVMDHIMYCVFRGRFFCKRVLVFNDDYRDDIKLLRWFCPNSKKIMLWVCFNGNLYHVEKIMTVVKYKQILIHHDINHLLKNYFEIKNVYFSKIVTQKAHSEDKTKKNFENTNWDVLEWAPQSLDLNSIENVSYIFSIVYSKIVNQEVKQNYIKYYVTVA